MRTTSNSSRMAICLATLCLYVASFGALAGETIDTSSSQHIIELVRAVQDEPNELAKVQKADALKSFVQVFTADPTKDVDAGAVAALTTLLTGPNVYVQVCAAESLGYLGPRARAAVAELRRVTRIVTRVERARGTLPFTTSVSLSWTLTKALSDITGESIDSIVRELRTD